MKLPNNSLIKDVANYYKITSKGNFTKWLSLMNPNAAIYYYTDGKLKHTRVCRLQCALNYR